MNYSSFYQKIIKAYSLVPRYFLNGYTFSPIQVFTEVTYRCNLECDFCQFLQAGPRNRQEEMSIEEFLWILKDVRRGALISFTGGEPFVKPGFVRLLDGVSKTNRTHIFTNATLITDEIAARLVQLGARNILDNGLVLIGISLEGLEETHNKIVKRGWAYQRTVSAIKSLVKHKRERNKKYPLIEIKAVISEKNVKEIHPLFSLARELGADIFNIMMMSMVPNVSRISGTYHSPFNPPPAVEGVDTDLLKGQLYRIRNEADGIQLRTTPQGISFGEIISHYENKFRIRDYTCYFPWYGLTVTACGDVIICPYAKIGNLREGGLKRLFNSDKARRFRKKLKKHRVFPGCLGCCCLTKKGAFIS